MTHLWVRAEQRAHEERVGLTPIGAKALIDAGVKLTVEHSSARILSIDGYRAAGAQIVAENSWVDAPSDAIIFGLKELPDDGTPLRHKHIMFGHAYKGQAAGQILLSRFKAGGGVLYDLEYLLNDANKRIAAFGYWAGFAGAAVSLKAWVAQQRGLQCDSVGAYPNQQTLIDELLDELNSIGTHRPTAIIIGALGRVGNGAADLCRAMDVKTTPWDINETAHGGPFPEILMHDVFLNCILANEGVPQFVPRSVKSAERQLSVIGDIACDPDSAFNPVPVYSQVTTWKKPVTRVHPFPVLDVMAIDNLPSMLPLESSQDFSDQLLPVLMELDNLHEGAWAKAHSYFQDAMKSIR